MSDENKVLCWLTPGELALVCEALDSHVYWQLSETQYRNSGHVLDPGADSPEAQAEIKRARELQDELLATRRAQLDST